MAMTNVEPMEALRIAVVPLVAALVAELAAVGVAARIGVRPVNGIRPVPVLAGIGADRVVEVVSLVEAFVAQQPSWVLVGLKMEILIKKN